jgi:hypothetical protein
MKEQIPYWGWFNGVFLHDFEDAVGKNPNMTIVQYYESFRAKHLNGQKFPLKNQGLTISMLYMVMVIPRELWEKDKNKRSQFPFRTKGKFKILVGSPKDNWDFLRLFRNAIAHANFDWALDGTYSFWNLDNKGVMNFKVTILHSDLFTFITEVGKYYLENISPLWRSTRHSPAVTPPA